MTIRTTIHPTNPMTEFPTLRRWVGDAPNDLVVLFTSSNEGVPLSGVPADRIGRLERWSDHNAPEWAPASITIASGT